MSGGRGSGRAWKRAGLAAAATLLTPLLVEGTIQLLGDPRYARIDEQLDELSAYWRLAKQGLLTLDDRDLRYRLAPGFRAEVAGVEYRVNELGLRGPDLAPSKPAGTKRVVLVGDSYAFGLGVAEQEGIAAQLQTLLPGSEVVNLGVPGYQTRQEHLLLQRVGFPLEPDLVVLLYFANDKEKNGLTWAPALHVLYHDDLPLPYSWKPFLAQSFLYAMVAKLDAARRYERGDYDARGATHWPLTAERIEALAADCAARGVPFVLAAIPEMSSTAELLDPNHEVSTDHAAVLALAARHDWPCVDLRAGMLGKVKAFEKLFLSLDPIDTHYNARGCRLAAELIAPVAAPLLAR